MWTDVGSGKRPNEIRGSVAVCELAMGSVEGETINSRALDELWVRLDGSVMVNVKSWKDGQEAWAKPCRSLSELGAQTPKSVESVGMT